MAIDFSPLWDFGDPALSEQRFRAALVAASADDALVLQTQIAFRPGQSNPRIGEPRTCQSARLRRQGLVPLVERRELDNYDLRPAAGSQGS